MASGRRLRYVSDCDENTSFSESESNCSSETLPSKTSKAEIQKRRLQKRDDTLESTTVSEGRVLTTNNGRIGKKGRCFSRNALLARENRLKKKLYMMNLESELSTTREKNKKLSGVVDNQLELIRDLNKEVKYLKSVLANSADICKLVRNINHNTGMSVRSSLDNKLSLNNCVSKHRYPKAARKTAHPFDESSNPTPDYTVAIAPEWISPQLPLCDDFDSILMNDASLGAFDFDVAANDDLFNEGQSSVNHEIPLEHNYTSLRKDSSCEDDVGVCLHVSKHRVSLEFCQTCSDQAHQNWDK